MSVVFFFFLFFVSFGDIRASFTRPPTLHNPRVSRFFIAFFLSLVCCHHNNLPCKSLSFLLKKLVSLPLVAVHGGFKEDPGGHEIRIALIELMREMPRERGCEAYDNSLDGKADTFYHAFARGD